MFRSMHVAFGAALTTLAMMVSPQVLAQHADIEAVVIGGKLIVDEENAAPVAFGTGYKIFEGDFGDLPSGLTGTDDPGFLAPSGTFLSGEQLWYHALGTLSFWNGTSWAAAPSGIALTVEDILGSETLISSLGATNPYGVIDQVDSAGGIHAHIDFSISNVNPVGAYLATFELTSRDASGNLPSPYLDSDPFQIAFNRGLSHEVFEASISALVSPVPEPQTYAMLLAGLALFGAVARRRKEIAG